MRRLRPITRDNVVIGIKLHKTMELIGTPVAAAAGHNGDNDDDDYNYEGRDLYFVLHSFFHSLKGVLSTRGRYEISHFPSIFVVIDSWKD